MATQTVLIVNQKDKRTLQEEAILKQLSGPLGHQVSVEGPECTPPQSSNIGLLVVCAGNLPGDFRKLEVPILVCNPTALYDLGMTMGKEGVDFGTQHYSSIFIRPEAVGEPLPADIIERRQVTEEKALQGWARPGAKALVVATVGGDNTKAVVFSYEKGEAMPGIEAPHRRGAFLATGDAKGQLKNEGWLLFDVAVASATEGSKLAAPNPVGLWFLRDGSPTRSMSAGEYRDWVHDQISEDVYNRLRRWGGIGVGTILTILGIAWAIISFYIVTQVKNEATQTEGRLAERFKDETARQMAQLVSTRSQALEKR
jgi:hypothetical protein